MNQFGKKSYAFVDCCKQSIHASTHPSILPPAFLINFGTQMFNFLHHFKITSNQIFTTFRIGIFLLEILIILVVDYKCLKFKKISINFNFYILHYQITPFLGLKAILKELEDQPHTYPSIHPFTHPPTRVFFFQQNP